jgi:V/A-type H+/Na+-transporting ATPase subunit G/H
MGGNSLNEKAAGETSFPHNAKRIQQVLEIERQAQAIHEAAMRQSEQSPIQAEQEAQALIEKARTDAEEEARQLVANAQAQEERARILAQAEEEVRRMEALAMSHFDRAVGYVLDRVAGRE